MPAEFWLRVWAVSRSRGGGGRAGTGRCLRPGPAGHGQWECGADFSVGVLQEVELACLGAVYVEFGEQPSGIGDGPAGERAGLVPGEVVHAPGEVELCEETVADGGGVGDVGEGHAFDGRGSLGPRGRGHDGDLAVGVPGVVDGGPQPSAEVVEGDLDQFVFASGGGGELQARSGVVFAGDARPNAARPPGFVSSWTPSTKTR